MKFRFSFLGGLSCLVLSACQSSHNEKNVASEAVKPNITAHSQFKASASDLSISRSDYANKLQGFWLAQSFANWTGLITELDKDKPPFYTDADWGSADLKTIYGEYMPHASHIDFYYVTGNKPWGADDDTDIEYMYQYLFEKNQTSLLSAEQIREGWLTHIYSNEDAPLLQKFSYSKPYKENFLWESNERARELMVEGVLPPQTSEPDNNKKSMMIDAQLTTEIFGLLSPARPDVALKLSHLPIRTTAKDDSEWIAQFYVIMHSLASYVEPKMSLQAQTEWLAQQARKQLPEGSTPAKMYDFVRQSYLANENKDDWELTRDQIYTRYQKNSNDGYVYHTPFEANINFAASLVSLFYGEGDLMKTIKVGSLVGWDSDNPTATWGGLLGFMMGHEAVVSSMGVDNTSDNYSILRTRRNFPDNTPKMAGEDTFTLMGQRGVKVIDRIVVEQMNGAVDEDNDVWLIPNNNGLF